MDEKRKWKNVRKEEKRKKLQKTLERIKKRATDKTRNNVLRAYVKRS
jgi:hypothetical protein